MIWFIFFIIVALGINIAVMVQKQKSAREIGLFVTIILLGFADWISIFLERQFNPNQWIAKLIDLIGL
ncbi:hypothetical protein GCM10008018_30600 [Paenibacillus marchantiophytorum]|uniref:DUF2759 family protein n=1 Tax=Paenibacillus marchantiophytorum TaxID=1619310 RepID=A0ABQ1EQI3_9BACL|nr:hypothetical protein [Paenibacillus marchantiophytorum]GFZ82641.1 hypothetical protein GCM10008018_30600 [Paenibacillus marchantiophytorum]